LPKTAGQRPQQSSGTRQGRCRAASRRLSAPSEFGALAFGPRGSELADRVLDAINVWHDRRDPLPEFTLHPACTPDKHLPHSAVIDKTHRRLVVRVPAQ
jgi:hypothetical protein